MRHALLPIMVWCAVLVTPLSAPAQADTTYWWNDAVFYEIFVRSFYDSNGDGIGDLQGIIQKLDYLNDGNPATTTDLGVRGIWLMPVNPSPSYHGYDVTDYRSINQNYGSLADFSALIQAAHARGIRVVIDFVMNHSSSQHPWFVESSSGSGSPKRDWYQWSATNPGYTGPWGQQVWHPLNGAYYFGLFWGGMPDLNYWNPEVKSAMFDVARFWLDTMQVDGFRLDAIKHLYESGTLMQDHPSTFIFLRELRQVTKAVNPDAMTVGEVWSATTQVGPYADGTGMDFCFEFDLGYNTISAVNTANATGLVNKMAEVVSTYRPLQYAPFLTNHDQDRVFGQLGQDVDRMKLAAAIYLTLPGIPFIYYGEEVGMIGSGQDPNKRTPMQWTAGTNAGFTTGTPWRALNANYPAYNVAVMQADSTSLWQWYNTLISTRNGAEALRRGDYAPITTGSSTLYSFARRTDRSVVVALHNLSTTPAASPTLALPGSPLPPGTYEVRDLLGNSAMPTIQINTQGGFSAWQPSVTIPGRGTMLVEIATMRGQQQVVEGWNLLSLPVDVDDRRTSVVYPGASSSAYGFVPGSGYTSLDTLCDGYWIKFPAPLTVPVRGTVRSSDTAQVQQGWNIIAALSTLLPVSRVQTLPPGLIGSSFYGFTSGGSYAVTDTLQPGHGYWVKVLQSGAVILKKQ